jgi:hypothetical protein
MRKKKPRKPSLRTSVISSRQDLDSFLCAKGLTSTDIGVALDSEDTGSLSAYLKSITPEVSRKLYPSQDKAGRCICGRIDRNGVDSWACLFPRIDGNDIDFDYAIWDYNNQLSTVYHPTFDRRTSPSADMAKELDVVYAKGTFKISDLSSLAPTVHAAFQCCKKN